MITAIVVITTTPDRELAQHIARSLVEKRLAACVQIDGPVESWYRWQGQLETATEWRLMIKSRSAVYAELEQAIRTLHPYEQPEIVALPISAGSAGYLKWIDEET